MHWHACSYLSLALQDPDAPPQIVQHAISHIIHPTTHQLLYFTASIHYPVAVQTGPGYIPFSSH